MADYKFIRVKCVWPNDDSWELNKEYTCRVWYHSTLDITFYEVFYDYENNPNYVQFGGIDRMLKEFEVLKGE